MAQWLQAGGARAAFYESISRKTREWSSDRRGGDWHCADALAMAWVLAPDGALETAARPVEVALAHGPARGVTVVDWQRQLGRPDNATLLLRYDRPRFEALVRAALQAG